ncbi:hypothetical protein TNCV_2283751 [Trichonephila clavipes]|nr:hypothetical protein TNCV_2283751 [Trichonephila clavipes]
MSLSSVPLKNRRVGVTMHVKSVESSNVLLLVWCGNDVVGDPNSSQTNVASSEFPVHTTVTDVSIA